MAGPEAARDLDALCAAGPEHEEELRRRHALVERVAATLPGRLLAKRLAERYGSEADPHVTLASADELEPVGGFSAEVIERLGERKGAFGRYALKGEIGRGGQGAMVRVWDQDLRHALAMKVQLGTHEAHASGETPPVDARSLGRFPEEAQVTSQLDHPRIVPVHELGLDGLGCVYFTMRLVKGETLKSVLEHVASEEDGWTLTRVLGVLQRVCQAMSCSHRKGVVHRDLKPGIVMVGRFGEVYVRDWGLAKVLGRPDAKQLSIAPPTATARLSSERHERAGAEPDPPLVTLDGDVVGTPAYMSPEQAIGSGLDVGRRSDVYALSARLYHALSGHMPYLKPGMRRSNYAIWYQVQAGPPEAIARRAPTAPVEFVGICERAMARESASLYPDMEALSADLSAFLDGRVVAAYETGGLAEAKKWVLRNRPLAAALAAALALLVAGLAVSMVFKARALRYSDETQEQALLAKANEAPALESEATAREQERVAMAHAAEVLRLSAL